MTWDTIVVGAGIGGLVTATQLAAKGATVLVLEQYLIPGGSGGTFERPGYRFDVGASMIFGFGCQGTTNLLTRALAAVDMQLPTIPDPVQIHYHLPDGLNLKVHRQYEDFLQELIAQFPHEAKGIRQFYDACWRVFNCLNVMDLLSLEEPRYLARVFLQHPLACFGLLRYLPRNVGEIARRYIRDRRLLRFIDMECFCWSTVLAERTPMINAGMVFSDRHYGGVRYPQGGVGQIAQKLVEGLTHVGSSIRYKAKVRQILLEQGRAIGVQLTTGEKLYADRIVSNATRWDTFGKLLPDQTLPRSEVRWQQNYQQSPSFLSLHLGVNATVLPTTTECHHILLEDWQSMEQEQGTIFVSIPTLLDPTLAPPGKHIIHTFTPSWMSAWQGLSPTAYRAKKQRDADRLIQRLERLFPGLSAQITLQEVGTPRTHRRFLGRINGTYGPIPQRRLRGLLKMPFNRTSIKHLYCVGDSTFPGQGLNAVAFSGFACAHRIAADLRL
ncbi:carotene isomerase [filamentous cyanobacterium LEGE 11480]|uniref:prolycopene isomerase n=1 Tax=Romeriopsis navalis LEGE 11480 TaxID=2777977 RepID=A0A928Z5U4_9CYAN|nr:carotenoid isomerase [Romeriopsis navalis]MBE9033169.1 carotene isomerase [Romeriopsis navalis LEGE 11480]